MDFSIQELSGKDIDKASVSDHDSSNQIRERPPPPDSMTGVPQLWPKSYHRQLGYKAFTPISQKDTKVGPSKTSAMPAKNGQKAKKFKKPRFLTKEEEAMKKWIEEMSEQLHEEVGPSDSGETFKKIKDVAKEYRA